LAFLGRVTFFVALPDEHRRVVGRPFTDGLTENVQLVAFLTEAMSVTVLSIGVEGKFGVTLNAMTEGLGVLAAPAVATCTRTRATTAMRTAERLMVFMVQLASLHRGQAQLAYQVLIGRQGIKT
jgi:hypothetical protein